MLTMVSRGGGRVKVKGTYQLARRKEGVYIPCVIILALFVLTYLSEANFNNNFANYSANLPRDSLSFVPKSSDMDFVLNIIDLNYSAQEVEYSFYVHAWLDINVTEIDCALRTYYSSEVFAMKNLGRASYSPLLQEAWGWYYQIENATTIKEPLSGFSQKYPYDYYSLSFSLTFLTQGLKPNFNESFQPTIFIPLMYGWRTETYSRPVNVTDENIQLDVGVVVGRDTSLAVLQFMIPTMAIYVLIGYSLFAGSTDKLKNRINLCLTTAVLTLTLYTFLLGQIAGTPIIIQGLAVSLVVSNVILVIFSIISSSENRSSGNWDLYAMFLVSLTPIVYLLLSAYSITSRLFQLVAADPLWKIQNLLLANVDYRFLLWFIIFQLALWSAYLYTETIHKRNALVFVTFLTGLGILFFNSLKGGPMQEIAFTVLGAAMVIISGAQALVWFTRGRRSALNPDLMLRKAKSDGYSDDEIQYIRSREE
jgi:hypothetical protein